MSKYSDIDITKARLDNEIECIDEAIGEHIERGVCVNNLMPLARLRADLSIQRTNLCDAMDKEASVTEIHFNVEELDFDVESTLNGQGSITLETIR